LSNKHAERGVYLKNTDEILPLFGKFDERLSLLEDHFAVNVIPKRDELSLKGEKEDVEKVYALFQELLALIREGHSLTTSEFNYALKLAGEGQASKIKNLFSDLIFIAERGKRIRPKTLGQKQYVEALRRRDIVFGIGPAGTGKTYLAMAMAVSALKKIIFGSFHQVPPAWRGNPSSGYQHECFAYYSNP
jgi:phosphate starvation-inducible PhoH-like protein